MKELKKLSRVGLGRAAHSHIIYINDETGVGLCSTELGHTHEIIYQDAIDPEMDEAGNEISPGSPATWVVQPALDGHTHQIEDYQVKAAKKKEEDSQVLSDIRELFKTGREIEKESIEKARESEKF